MGQRTLKTVVSWYLVPTPIAPSLTLVDFVVFASLSRIAYYFLLIIVFIMLIIEKYDHHFVMLAKSPIKEKACSFVAGTSTSNVTSTMDARRLFWFSC